MQGGNNAFDRIFKITLSGDSGVGKSNVISRFTNNRYCADHASTVGVEFSARVVPVAQGAAKIKAQLWDTCGQERFKAVTNVYYRGAMGALLVYDIMSYDSFAAVPRWLREIRDHAKRDIVIMLLGNKADCDDEAAAAAEKASAAAIAAAKAEGADEEAAAAAGAAASAATTASFASARQVPRADAEALASEYGLLFAEVSAKTGAGVDAAVNGLIEKMYSTVVTLERGPDAAAATTASTAAAAAGGAGDKAGADKKVIDVAGGAAAETAEGEKKCCK